MIFLWCHPRSCSTAFERAVHSAKQTAVLHEPLSVLYDPLRAEQKQLTSDEYSRLIGTLFEKHGANVFIKDMCYHACFSNRFDDLQARLLRNHVADKKVVHSFLIRDPRKSGKSLRKMQQVMGYASRPHVFEEQLGVVEQHRFFQEVMKADNWRGKLPVVVDADDLMQQPERVMKAYCAATGLSYSPKMLLWAEGDYPPAWDDKRFNGWHDDAKGDAQFSPVPRHDYTELLTDEHQKIMQSSIRIALPLYKEMYAYRIGK